MAQPARNFEQPHDRASRLLALGLRQETIEAAVAHGLTARLLCSPFHPPSYPGIRQWAETHARIRELLVPESWTPSDHKNYSRVISPDERVALTVATGDGQTGQTHGFEPQTKYPKGTETRLAVETNGQLSLLPEDMDPLPHLLETWILLIATDEHQVNFELSLPKTQDSMGRVVSWSERIIFPPIDIDSLPGRDDHGDDDDEGGAGGIDVPVERV